MRGAGHCADAHSPGSMWRRDQADGPGIRTAQTAYPSSGRNVPDSRPAEKKEQGKEVSCLWPASWMSAWTSWPEARKSATSSKVLTTSPFRRSVVPGHYPPEPMREGRLLRPCCGRDTCPREELSSLLATGDLIPDRVRRALRQIPRGDPAPVLRHALRGPTRLPPLRRVPLCLPD